MSNIYVFTNCSQFLQWIIKFFLNQSQNPREPIFLSALLRNCFLHYDCWNGDARPTLDAALLCSSRADSDLGCVFGLVWGVLSIGWSIFLIHFTHLHTWQWGYIILWLHLAPSCMDCEVISDHLSNWLYSHIQKPGSFIFLASVCLTNTISSHELTSNFNLKMGFLLHLLCCLQLLKLWEFKSCFSAIWHFGNLAYLWRSCFLFFLFNIQVWTFIQGFIKKLVHLICQVTFYIISQTHCF